MRFKLSTRDDKYSAAETEAEWNYKYSFLFRLPNLHKTL